MKKAFRLGVLGATGLVGRKMMRLLEDVDWIAGDPLPLVSEHSAGTTLSFKGRSLICEQVRSDHFGALDLVLFSAGGQASRQWGPVAEQCGAWVVDNSSAFRMEGGRLLIVPEVNGHLVQSLGTKGAVGGLIPNPNCSTIQIAMAVAALEKGPGLQEVQVTTLQAVSGAGQSALEVLHRQNAEQAGCSSRVSSYADPVSGERLLAGNVWPAIGGPTSGGSFEEETKVEHELRKILDRGKDLAVTCTATRVPVEVGHCAAVRVVCRRDTSAQEAFELLAAQSGLSVSRDPHAFKTPVDLTGKCDVHVGRLRQDPNNPKALLMWVVADNLMKGAAWNSIQIAALLAGRSLS